MPRKNHRYTDIKILPNGRQVYIYDEDGIAKRKSIKDRKVNTIKKSISEIIESVTTDMRTGSEVATVVGLILCTYERVGNDSSADNGHFGASNLLKKHVKKTSFGIEINYIAKSGVEQRKPVYDKEVSTAILRIIRSKNLNERIFSCTAKQVNDYLSEFGITSKDIRTYAANKFMKQALSGKVPETKTERTKVFNEKLKTVAEIIGHKPATLKSMYLSDKVKNYINEGKIKL